MKHLSAFLALSIAICTVAAAVLPKVEVVDRDNASSYALEANAANDNHLTKRTNNNKDDNAWVQDFLRAQARFSYLPDPHREGNSRATTSSQSHRPLPPPQTVAQPALPVLPSAPLSYQASDPQRSRSTTARTFTDLLQLLQNRFPIVSPSLLQGNPLQQAGKEAHQQPNAYIWNHGTSHWEVPRPTVYPSHHVPMHNWTQMAMQGTSALDPASASTSTSQSHPLPMPMTMSVDEQLTGAMHPHQLYSRAKQPHPHRYHPYASPMSHLLNSGRLPITMSEIRYHHQPRLTASSPLWQHLSSSQEEAHNPALAAAAMSGHFDAQQLPSLGMMNSQQQSQQQQQHHLHGTNFLQHMSSSLPSPPPPPVVAAEENAPGYPYFQRLHEVAQRWPAPHETHQEVDQPAPPLQDRHLPLTEGHLYQHDTHGFQRGHVTDITNRSQAQYYCHQQQQQQHHNPSEVSPYSETPHLPLEAQQSASVEGRNEYLHSARPSPERTTHHSRGATLPPPHSVHDLHHHHHQGQYNDIATSPTLDGAPLPSSSTPLLDDDHHPSDPVQQPHHDSDAAIAHQLQQGSPSSPSSHKSYPPPRSSQSDSAGGVGREEEPLNRVAALIQPPPPTLPSFINYDKERARYLRNAQTFGWDMESEPWSGPIVDPMEANQPHPESAFWRGLIQDSYKMDYQQQEQQKQASSSRRRKGKMALRISDPSQQEEELQEQRGGEWDKLTNDQAYFLDKVLKLSKKIRVPGAPRMERFNDISPSKRDDHIFKYLQQKINRIRNRMQEGHTWDIEDNELLQYLIDREYPGTDHLIEVYRTQKDRIVDSWGTKPKSLAKMATNPLGMRAEDFLSLLMSKKQQGQRHSPSPSPSPSS